jgi:hypothetical protein
MGRGDDITYRIVRHLIRTDLRLRPHATVELVARHGVSVTMTRRLNHEWMPSEEALGEPLVVAQGGYQAGLHTTDAVVRETEMRAETIQNFSRSLAAVAVGGQEVVRLQMEAIRTRVRELMSHPIGFPDFPEDAVAIGMMTVDSLSSGKSEPPAPKPEPKSRWELLLEDD